MFDCVKYLRSVVGHSFDLIRGLNVGLLGTVLQLFVHQVQRIYQQGGEVLADDLLVYGLSIVYLTD